MMNEYILSFLAYASLRILGPVMMLTWIYWDMEGLRASWNQRLSFLPEKMSPVLLGLSVFLVFCIFIWLALGLHGKTTLWLLGPAIWISIQFLFEEKPDLSSSFWGCMVNFSSFFAALAGLAFFALSAVS